MIFPCDLALADGDAVPLVTGLASCEAEGLPDAMRAASSRASGSGPFRGRCRTRMTSWRASFELAHLLCGSSAAARRTTRPRGGSERFLDTTRRRPTRISHGAPQRAPSTLQELSSRFPAAGQRSARRVASTTAREGRGSGNVTVSRSASTPLHTIESASSTEQTSMS